jgi:ATP-binding protein involved in chromosome partitioning
MKTPAKKIYLVGSGKGGVGKSTIALNFAISLAQENYTVGLLDADLYGPSIPIMTGLRNVSPRTSTEGGSTRIIPFAKFGIHMISLGFFIEECRSILWRGPMLHGMLEKMIHEVLWSELDVLVIDLPPGTGDVPLSLSQLIQIEGVIVVTTPQDVAIVDVLKAIHSFDQLKIPLIGLVENMAGFVSPDTHQLSFPFGQGKGQQLAERLNIPFLGSIPFLLSVREGSDQGIPAAFLRNQESSLIFRNLARNFLHVLK